ncbi:MAG: alpha-L-rhamnosidase [Ruminococcus sp.]|nr:alpha-L-rhamnosidase [Ruminococcus sp.]
MEKRNWIWYPGDFELYHAMKQNFSRVERGYGWPAFWKSEGFRNRVAFRRTYELEEETTFCVWSDAIGYVMAGEQKKAFGHPVVCGPGKVSVSVHAGCIEKFPSIYIEGAVIYSDAGWMVEDYEKPPVPVGYSRYFTEKRQDPSIWEYSETLCYPVKTEEVEGGVLFEFETEMTAILKAEPGPKTDGAYDSVSTEDSVFGDKKDAGETVRCFENRKLEIRCGESREEALSPQCYYSWQPDAGSGECPCCALRYAYIPHCKEGEVSLTARYQYVEIPAVASFHCDDGLLNRIWEVAAHTFSLCSGIFFLDGIKRDKWIWCGDAYQSLFVNQYLMADPDINRRTLLALRGNERMTTHINTILDYTMYWVLCVKEHYEAYADHPFLIQVFPKMCALMEFLEEQLDEHGFVVGRKGDWIYIDWAEFDKTGPFCPEQMLLAACYQVMGRMAEMPEAGRIQAGNPQYLNPVYWKERYETLVSSIRQYFWDEEKQAYVDSFTSGKRNVTRHANIFAILFEIADEKQRKQIVRHVLHNEAVPKITTPYFKFFELDALCRMGCLDEVLETIRSYWGGMLKQGAVTFWEEYDPEAPKEEQYGMYGDPFGKSLCHAWAASPIYLLGKYFLGVRPLSAGYQTYEVQPKVQYFRELDCVVPVYDRTVHITYRDSSLQIKEEKNV